MESGAVVEVASPVDDDRGLPAEFNTWAPARQQAWMQMAENPNAFYYRHRLPEEERKNGAWDSAEKALFLEELKKFPSGVSQWGLFARAIPGRVGYQCNSFYRKLIASGEVQGAPGSEVVPIPVPPSPRTSPETVPSDDPGPELPPIVKVPKKKKVYHGDNYAYKYNIVNGKNFAFVPKMDYGCTFREWLCDWLKDEKALSDFSKKMDVYNLFDW
jgi:hypothetical protein